MDPKAATKMWEEICYLLSDGIKPNILEKDFESQVVRALEVLGWKEFAGEIKRQPELKLGRNTRLRPDVVVYGNKGYPLIVVEVKKPSLTISKDEPAEQLLSYMRQLKTEFGLLVGQRIRFYYDGRENKRSMPLLLKRVDFNKNNAGGEQLVQIFNRKDFLNKNYLQTVNKLLDDFTAKSNIRELRGILQEKGTVKKIIQFLKEEYSDFGPDVVEGALNGIQIELSYDLESTDIPVPKDDQDSPNGLLATVLDTIQRHKDGISKKDLIGITGFTDKQITNAIYKLKVRNVITSERRGFYRANDGGGDENTSIKILSGNTKMSNNEEKLPDLQEGTMIHTIYNLISKRKMSGYTVEELRIETGFDSRQIANLLYKLSKKGYINAVERGRYVAN